MHVVASWTLAALSARCCSSYNINPVVSYLFSYYRYTMYAIIHTASIVLTVQSQHTAHATTAHTHQKVVWHPPRHEGLTRPRCRIKLKAGTCEH